MRQKIVLFFLLLLPLNAIANESDIQKKIDQLNQQSIDSLGISLNALNYLAGASGNSFMPLWHLQESGEISYIRELEKAGYVEVYERKGLPNGRTKEETFINIWPLQSGEDIKRCLKEKET